MRGNNKRERFEGEVSGWAKFFAAISYVGILILASLFFVKSEPFVKFHVKQACKLWIMGVVAGAAYNIISIANLKASYVMTCIFVIVIAVCVAFGIVGFVSALMGKERKVALTNREQNVSPVEVG